MELPTDFNHEPPEGYRYEAVHKNASTIAIWTVCNPGFIYNDGNDVDLRQTNAGDHYMSVILGGTQPTDISVIQNGWNNKSYSITNYCYTTGGCSISVTQGN